MLTRTMTDFVGTFHGTNRLWFRPDTPQDDEQPIELTGEAVHGGKFLLLKYTSASTGKPLVGELLLGFDDRQQRAEGNWVDSFHMGNAMLHLVGQEQRVTFADDAEATPDTSPFRLQLDGDYFAAEGHPRWGWRIVLESGNQQHFFVRMYNIPPGIAPALAVEFELTKQYPLQGKGL